MFRFAVTDYFAGNVSIEDSRSETGLLINDKAYVAEETVFFDFDIIQLTFNKEGVYRVIPVVSNPVDIVGAITPPVEFEGYQWWKILLAIIILILLVILLFPILPWIIKAVVWVLSLPGRGVLFIFKNLKSREKVRERKRDKKEM